MIVIELKEQAAHLQQQEQLNKKPLLVLIGPTAVGKTALSIELAKKYNAEIISGDSMQVYRGMDIGTAKIKEEERDGIPHHLIDICDPDESYSAADFQYQASKLIDDIYARGKLPFVVGGTGLYIESLCYQYRFAQIGSDAQFRLQQEQFVKEYGNEALHAKLRSIDPASADKLHPNDVRRVIRALEVHHVTGQTFSEQQKNQVKESPYHLCIIGLTMDRAKLYARIEQRIDEMLEEGLLDEVKRLLSRDLPLNAVPMQALGYKELISYLKNEISYDEAVSLLKRDTRRFAKRQLSWFRHMDDIYWFDAEENKGNNYERIHDIIAGKFQDHIEYSTNQSLNSRG